MTTLLRYTVLQIPALACVAVLAFALWRFAGLSGWVAVAAVLLWAAKDVAFYPLVRGAYAGGAASETARLVGRCGVARQPLDPSGYVAIGSELWRAEIETGATPIDPGKTVRVVGARRLTLIVTPAE